MPITKPFEFFIQWHLTEKCNLRCRHCYQEGPNIDEMPLPEIKNTIAEASDMIGQWSEAYGIPFSRSMNITGGEPFLRRDFFDILTEIKKSGFKTYVLTNGTLLDKARAKALAEIGVDGVQVSIEGPEDVHDSIRGQGSFAAAASGVRSLVDSGLEVTLNVTLSRLNARHIRSVIAFASRSGVRRVGFARLVPSGKGKDLLSLILNQEELEDIYSSLLSLRLESIEIVTGDPVAGRLRDRSGHDGGNIAINGCAAAISGLTIGSNGTIFPCRRLPVSLGNVRTDSLREIWATSPVLTALRNRTLYKGKCGACLRWASCRGCRAIAYAWSRSKGGEDYLAEDPQCFFRAEEDLH